jgi:hypothetical protein
MVARFSSLNIAGLLAVIALRTVVLSPELRLNLRGCDLGLNE